MKKFTEGKVMQKKKINTYSLLLICIVGGVLVNIKSIFADFDIDSEYAIAMSYRMIKGDRMFLQMWEPHQTSAFLLTFFSWLYLSVVKSTAGIAIFLQLMGVLLQLGVTLAVYKVLRKKVDPVMLGFMCVFLFTVRPKDIVLPEFSNMQIWFSILLFLCLLKYTENQRKKGWLLAASVCLCGEIISYPSCLIVYFVVIGLLFWFSEEKWKDFAVFTAGCALQGAAYVSFFAVRMGGIWALLSSLRRIVTQDESHSEARTLYLGPGRYLEFFILSVAMLCICAVFAFIIKLLIERVSGKYRTFQEKYLLFWKLFFLCFSALDILNVLIRRDRFSYILIFAVMIALGIWGLRECSKEEKRIFITGTLISMGSFVSTLLLTNVDLLPVFKYCILGVMVSFLPIGRLLDNRSIAGKSKKWGMIALFCLIILFRRGMMVETITEMGANLFDLGGIIQGGPAVGIVTDYMGAYVINTSLPEYNQYVREGENLLLVGEPVIGPIGYLFENTQVSVPSTICTPTFNEMMLEYWKENPEKFPDVIAVECWYGDFHVPKDSWIMEWIENEYHAEQVMDGKYLRFYRKKAL